MSTLSFWTAIGVGIIAAIGSLVIVESIGRKFCDIKKALVAEHDPLRDGPFEDSESYLNELKQSWPGLLDEQDAVRRKQG